MRVFYSRRSIERSELARLTQIDYEREMAFIATRAAADGRRGDAGRGARRGRPRQPSTPSSASSCAPTSRARGLGELLMRQADPLPARARHAAPGGHGAAREPPHAATWRASWASRPLPDEPGDDTVRIALPLG